MNLNYINQKIIELSIIHNTTCLYGSTQLNEVQITKVIV